jgi:undecaprenyl diphosphate synthase
LSSNSASAATDELNPENLPAHIAIIMDGNGRWARKRLLNRIQGHEKGADTVRTVVRACREIGIAHLTLYAFSTENWQRPRLEVEALMNLLKRFLVSERRELLENGVRLNAIGEIERLPADVRATLFETMSATEKNTGLCLHLALSYGARSEIVRMVRTLARKTLAQEITPDDITAESVSQHLYTRETPDPDLLIRTSGEMRISNFLLWQIAYAEIFITDTLWPDFSREELIRILKDYQSRERRFGRVEG